MAESVIDPTPQQIAAECALIRSQPEWHGQDGGAKLLLAAILRENVEHIEKWCDLCRNPHDRWTLQYLRLREAARRAMMWIWSDEAPLKHEAKFTFLQICGFLSLDPTASREQLVRRFPFKYLEALDVEEFQRSDTKLAEPLARCVMMG